MLSPHDDFETAAELALSDLLAEIEAINAQEAQNV